MQDQIRVLGSVLMLNIIFFSINVATLEANASSDINFYIFAALGVITLVVTIMAVLLFVLLVISIKNRKGRFRSSIAAINLINVVNIQCFCACRCMVVCMRVCVCFNKSYSACSTVCVIHTPIVFSCMEWTIHTLVL